MAISMCKSPVSVLPTFVTSALHPEDTLDIGVVSSSGTTMYAQEQIKIQVKIRINTFLIRIFPSPKTTAYG
jgi:hypothetical protein